MEQALIALGREELERLITERDETDVTCEFCRTSYRLTRKEPEDLRREITPAGASA